jgi:hypothetical protein
MLVLPTSGISSPTGSPPDEIKHNIELDIFCDWIESCVLFDEDDLSTTDVVDILMDGDIYDNPDSALQIVERAWNELKRRRRWIGKGCPFSFIGQTISAVASWEENPAYSFCILLSMPRCYEDWSTRLNSGGYSEQGRLFESLTKESIENQFLDWEVYHTGWSASNPVKLSELVVEVANQLGENTGPIRPWADPDGKDEGLDLLCYRPFPDKRAGIPVYLMQCASGKHWIDKLHEPDLDVWTKIVLFAAKPRKAFAIPFALLEEEFMRRCNQVDGMLLDRYRLLGAARYNKEWVSDCLKDEIINWLTPRLETLPRYE